MDLGLISQLPEVIRKLKEFPAVVNARWAVMTPWSMDSTHLSPFPQMPKLADIPESSSKDANGRTEKTLPEKQTFSVEHLSLQLTEAMKAWSVSAMGDHALPQSLQVDVLDAHAMSATYRQQGKDLIAERGFVPKTQQLSTISQWMNQWLWEQEHQSSTAKRELHYLLAYVLARITREVVARSLPNYLQEPLQLFWRDLGDAAEPHQSLIEHSPDAIFSGLALSPVSVKPNAHPQWSLGPLSHVHALVSKPSLPASSQHQINIRVVAQPGSMALLGKPKQLSSIRLIAVGSDQTIQEVGTLADWALIDSVRPDQVQPRQRFGMSVRRWRPMPFVMTAAAADADGSSHLSPTSTRQIHALLRFEVATSALDPQAELRLEIPQVANLGALREVRKHRAKKLSFKPLPRAVPQVELMPPWEQYWHSGEVTWHQLRDGMPWLSRVDEASLTRIAFWLDEQPNHQLGQVFFSLPYWSKFVKLMQ